MGTAAAKARITDPARIAAAPAGDVSHNLNGQKLGRKGQATRERILTAANDLLTEADDLSISLSAVARQASLGMTSLYNYFADLTELLLALLGPVMFEAGEKGGYIDLISEYWPDDELEDRCKSFIEAYFGFWARHSRILHLRNNMADQYDERMLAARVRSAQPVISRLRLQMCRRGDEPTAAASQMASVLMTGIERAVTVATDPKIPEMIEREFGPRNTKVIDPLTRLLVMAIRDSRSGG